MKSKYQGLANIIIFGVSIALMVFYGIYQATLLKGSIQISSPAVVPAINIPDQATLAYIDFLNQHLTDIARLNQNNSQVDLKLFGFDPLAPKKEHTIPDTPDRTSVSDPGSLISFSYSLTLCFASPKGSFCSIDGKLYKEKAILPDGAKIIKIENNRVLILKQDKKEWVYPRYGQMIPKQENEENK
ncbi:MAG: hypothetical protein ABIJ31_03270 [Pseudomonadota bacterium]